MFEKLLGRFSEVKVLAPLSGEAIPLAMVDDPVFSGELLGKGVAIRPDDDRVVSPVNGTVALMFDTGHAVILKSHDGVEVLIHVGIDTIKLKGKHYIMHVKTGDEVDLGCLLLEFDAAAIAAEGFDTVTPIVICNSEHFTEIKTVSGKRVCLLDELIVAKK